MRQAQGQGIRFGQFPNTLTAKLSSLFPVSFLCFDQIKINCIICKLKCLGGSRSRVTIDPDISRAIAGSRNLHFKRGLLNGDLMHACAFDEGFAMVRDTVLELQ